MKNFAAKPYKLIGKIQNYEWGTKNKEAFIPKFLGEEPKQNVPYAEYWIGVHPKAPSDVIIDKEKISLIELLKEFPNEILGNRISDKFNNTLPFLLKLLSINQALSIQSHPNKELAKVLHQKDPKNYPDENHKPEIAIAIDNLTALVGLKNLVEIRKAILQNPEIEELLTNETLNKLKNINTAEKDLVKSIYSEIMKSTSDKLEKSILSIKNRLESKEDLIQSEKQFLLQFDNYGIDVGLISILLFNIVNLKSGEAIFTPAGIPHAYIKGNIVECMANSDNVVRAGLTPKYQDTETLLNMLETDSSQAVVDIYEKEDRTIYKTFAEEFELEKLNFTKEIKVENNKEIKILMILEGIIEIKWENEGLSFTKGDVVMLPAILNNYKIVQSENSLVYQVKVP